MGTIDASKDLAECSQTIIQLAHLADEKKLDDFVGLFEPNGQIVFSGNVHRGHSVIRELMETRFSLGRTLHICSPPSLAFRKDGSIDATTHVILYRFAEGETDAPAPVRVPDAISTYHDHLVRVGSDWRFISREIRPQLA